jgi:hypothetical protein
VGTTNGIHRFTPILSYPIRLRSSCHHQPCGTGPRRVLWPDRDAAATAARLHSLDVYLRGALGAARRVTGAVWLAHMLGGDAPAIGAGPSGRGPLGVLVNSFRRR